MATSAPGLWVKVVPRTPSSVSLDDDYARLRCASPADVDAFKAAVIESRPELRSYGVAAEKLRVYFMGGGAPPAAAEERAAITTEDAALAPNRAIAGFHASHHDAFFLVTASLPAGSGGVSRGAAAAAGDASGGGGAWSGALTTVEMHGAAPFPLGPVSSHHTPPSSSQSQGTRTLEHLLGLSPPLSAEALRVLRTVRTRFSARALLCTIEQDADSALQLFMDAELLPSSVTRVELSAAHHIVLDGPLVTSIDPTKLTKCWRGLEPFVLKSLTLDERVRVAAWQEVIARESVPPSLTPFEVLSHGPKAFMLMPWYLHTVSTMPALAADALVGLFGCMEGALDFIHSKGFAHCDIKPANICVDFHRTPQFVSVDLGSIAQFGRAAFATSAYIPSDFDGTLSCAQLDWWMLAVTLTEKLHSGFKVGQSERAPRKAAVKACLEARLPAVWAKLEPRLTY